MKIRKSLIGVLAVIAACSFLKPGTAIGADQIHEGVATAMHAAASPYYLAYGAPFRFTYIDTASYDFSYPYYGYDYGDNLPFQRGYPAPGFHDAYGYAPSCGGFAFGVCP